MTIKQVLKTIREMGLTATWNTYVQEFHINYKNGSEETAYYTQDKDDAIGTAIAMANNTK